MNGADLAEKVKRTMGTKVSWAEAQTITGMSRHTLFRRADEALRDGHPSAKDPEIARLWATKGIQFRVGPSLVWMGEVSGRIQIRVIVDT